MITLKIGDKAPAFEGKNQDGKIVRLEDFRGKKVALYFYPKDMTSGCTEQACNLRNNYASLQSKGFEIIGISADDEKSHRKFIEKNQLPFMLIADTDKKIHEQYGTWQEKKMYGRAYMGTVRTTFVIDEQGNIADVIEKVKTKEHNLQLLK
jgi:thioredoxin-dependent peroxiredoxin